MVREIPVKRKRLAEEQMYHLVTGLNGYLGLSIKLMENPHASPLHIGSGELELDNDGVYQAVSRNKSNPVIPGSGIKGAVRTFAEALGPCCLEGNCRNDLLLCPCCTLFGTLGFQGRVAFTEAVSTAELKTAKLPLPVRWGGKNQGGRRFYWHDNCESWVHSDIGSVERLEVILPPAEFLTTCYFQNLRDEELGFLFLAIGVPPDNKFSLKLGGGKNRGLGSVTISTQEIILSGNNRHASLTLPPALHDNSNLIKNTTAAYLTSLTPSELSQVQENLVAFQKESFRKLSPQELKQRFMDRAERQEGRKR